MKPTTKMFFISMLFSAVTPSVLLSSEEREERDGKRSNFINESKKFQLVDKNREGEFKIEDIEYTVPGEIACVDTHSESEEEELFKRFGKDEFEKFLNRRLVYFTFHSDEANCKKLLEVNADPNWKDKNDISVLDIAFKLHNVDPEKADEVFQLLTNN